MKKTMLAVILALPACSSSEVPKNIFAKMGEPVPFATADQVEIFKKGQAVSDRQFSQTDGLGPEFNVSSCGSCHEKPTRGGSAGRYRNFLLVGNQKADGSFALVGTNGIQAHYTMETASRVPTDATANVIATRHPIPFFGIGLVAEISESSILENIDEDDADGDGISGRSNKAAPIFLGSSILARFGRKAQVSSLEAFIRAPLFNHLGITTNPLTDTQRKALPIPFDFTTGITQSRLDWTNFFGLIPLTFAQGAALRPAQSFDTDDAADPELSTDDLFNLIAFTELMAAPKPDDQTPDSKAGETLFKNAGCAKCHIPALKSPRGMIPLFSDLLVHDMGPDLADGIVMGEAGASEFRTQPLWGIAAVSPYLHDGRADTLDEAIEAHGGEGLKAKEAYVAMSDTDRSQLISFLESLGGKSQQSEGLVAPDAITPAIGEYGGPRSTMSEDDASTFDAGRRAFDRDHLLSEGLGPLLNGDSCRACHFLPTLGGAGPMDVNVVRHGILDESLNFTAPTVGTIIHKLSALVETRPEPVAQANVFELRQTPPLFGLGLIDEIDDATIIALADPTDSNADGIMGRANILEDSRLGKFGWKANVPTLAEFARDAMTNELGTTVPDQTGLTFGKALDDDAISDAEISLSELQAVLFLMQQLGPPPRTRTDVATEDRGETVFSSVGCDKCHVPVLRTTSDEAVPLFSDLLLHDVAPATFSGIVDGNAGIRDFRTPPLWGLAKSGPYMHDGRSATIEDAISRHEGEAAATIEAFDGLSDQDKSDLIAFLGSL